MHYDASDAQFLMSIVDNPHSDYDDELDGYPNYGITTDPDTGAQVLRVTFEDSDGTRLEGEWRLSLVSLTKTGEPEAVDDWEEVAGE